MDTLFCTLTLLPKVTSGETTTFCPRLQLYYALLVGNPARQTGWMSEYGQKLVFDANGQAVCTESGQKYQLKNNRVERIS
jgi:hypothetical protein